MKQKPASSRNALPPRTASSTLRTIFNHMDELRLSQSAASYAIGAHPGRLNSWRNGSHEPGIVNVELLADAVGLEIVVREKQS